MQAPVPNRREELETVIERGLQTFVEVGNAIREIRDSRLYKDEYGTFEDYCRERWGWSKTHANRQVEAADTAAVMTPIGVMPASESHARELTPLAKEDPDAARELWAELSQNGKLTAADIKQAVRERGEYKLYLDSLPSQTRAALEQADENDEKHRNILRNSNQLNHLANIAEKRGDEVAAEVAELALTEERSSTFKAYEQMKEETASGDSNSLQVHYSSESPEWYTPPHIIDKVLDTLGAIELDPCSDSGSTVPAEQRFTAAEDGLSRTWRGAVYMNPPYGDAIVRWIRKLKAEYENGDVTAAVALVPSRTDTAWFAELKQYPRCFIRGRLKFSGHHNSAPFPSAVFYLGDDGEAFLEAFKDLGDIYRAVNA